MGIDIILITYNQEQYVAQALESILMQRMNEDVEVRVIVADDCSKDNTLEIIKSYEKKSPFPFVYLTVEKNMGIATNYKRAFEATEAEYVAVLEGDDWWTDVNRIQKHLDYLSTHTNCVMSKNNYMQYSQRHNEWSVQQSSNQILTLKQELRNYVLANMSCTVFRGNVLRCMDNRVYEYGHKQWHEATDWYIHIYILQYGYGYVLYDIMSTYRVDTGNNVSRTNRTEKDMLEKAYMCYEQTMELLNGKYRDECYGIYLSAQREVERERISQRIIRWSNYVPPCVAVLLGQVLPKILRHCKHIIRQCIPHVIYYKIKPKK